MYSTQQTFSITPSQTAVVDGIQINFSASLSNVDNLTLALVHGFGTSLESWYDIYPVLAAEFSVVRLDLKGSGFSAKPIDTRYSISDQAAILIKFLEQLRLKRVVLVGHSLGGAVSLLTYMGQLSEKSGPEIVALILIDSAGFSQKLPFFVSTLRNPITRLASHFLSPESRVKLVLEYEMAVKSQITPERVERYAHFLRLPGTEFALTQTAKYIVPENAEAIASRFSEITVPTLIIWGENDPVIPLESAYRFRTLIKNSKLVILPNTGHIPHEERPQRVLELIRNFIRSIK
ncbi:2-hydroxy-6-oxononadienedioate/2-hydroxy-6-oxononatrienedioate hydrolase [mine drainage metagenome]|uniref:2-hydroxy-6-oxononadienedioate/2-hydroxy-6-oxononatrienedioate hydrolase n=1 Tax=mine drainage metagenome TaxID=410659 RepID=A0A1J5SHS4_9ZZZZ